MKNALFWLSLVCLAAPSAHAAVYKCVADDTVTYQDTPCDGADSTTFVLASIRTESPAAKSEPATAIAPEPKPEPAPRVAQSPGLTLGMFDTEVLNMRGWGRPGKITRSKAKSAWREEWTYFSPQDGQRQLQFANGRLTGIW